MKTFHASAERSSPEDLKSQNNDLSENTFLSQLIDALPYVVTILNKNRQIVYSNQKLLETLKVSEFRELLGKRPGEALHCKHASNLSGGCGTSENCRVCGAVDTISASMDENRKVVNECRITTDIDGVEDFFDYEVTASPFKWKEEKYTIFSIADISGIKRKKILERIFFHDILNTAGNLKNLVEVLVMIEDPNKKEDMLALLGRVSNELVEEIQEQRQLSAAESGELTMNYTLVNTTAILESIIHQFQNNKKTPVKLLIAEDSHNLSFSSDKTLLTRILKNILKNAVEASKSGDTITISVKLKESSVSFMIHNPNPIARNVQLQIFKRSFSTKGTDRGLGTYSMKLLGERYMKGKVYFESDEKTGTVFYFDLPLN